MVKPLWTEVMELMGGEFRQMCDALYNDTDEDKDKDKDEDEGGSGSSSSGSSMLG